MKPRKWILVACLTGFATLWATPATAHLVSRSDPNDNPTKVDILKSSSDHQNGKLIFSFHTESAWTKNDIVRSTSNCYQRVPQIFFLDTKGDTDMDYSVAITARYPDSPWDAALENEQTDEVMVEDGFGTVNKTRKMISISFNQNAIRVSKAFRWVAVSQTIPNECGGDFPPLDQAGAYRHPN